MVRKALSGNEEDTTFCKNPNIYIYIERERGLLWSANLTFCFTPSTVYYFNLFFRFCLISEEDILNSVRVLQLVPVLNLGLGGLFETLLWEGETR